MSERPTPETDDQPIINAINDNGYQVQCVDIEFTRKLERERDEASMDCANGDIATMTINHYERILRKRDEWAAMCGRYKQERDDLQKAINGLCEHFKISPANTTLLAVEVLRIERERDEAREKYTTLLTDNMLDVHKLYKAIELIKSLINQIERPAYGVDEAVAKMFLMEEAKKFANEMQQM